MTESDEQGPLRLRAVDKTDVEIVSALLQDALLPMMDMAYQPSDARFVAVANRFRWEKGAETPERVLCGLRFEHVRAVRARGLDRTDRGRILSLLALETREAPEGHRLALIFAGGGELELTIDAVAIFVEDQGEPWPALSTPRHDDGPAS